MANGHTVIILLHLATVAITIVLFILRFFWLRTGSPMMNRRWVRIMPHANDTLLLLTGVMLVLITHFYPFSPQGSWLTVKIAGVILYIALGSVALSRRPRSARLRWVAFVMALLMLAVIVTLAITKVSIPGIV